MVLVIETEIFIDEIPDINSGNSKMMEPRQCLKNVFKILGIS